MFAAIASSIRTKSPAELVTTADRMTLAPFFTPTNDGVSSPNSDGISHAAVEHSSVVLALSVVVPRAVVEVVIKAFADPATAARATTDANVALMEPLFVTTAGQNIMATRRGLVFGVADSTTFWFG